MTVLLKVVGSFTSKLRSSLCAQRNHGATMETCLEIKRSSTTFGSTCVGILGSRRGCTQGSGANRGLLAAFLAYHAYHEVALEGSQGSDLVAGASTLEERSLAFLASDGSLQGIQVGAFPPSWGTMDTEVACLQETAASVITGAILSNSIDSTLNSAYVAQSYLPSRTSAYLRMNQLSLVVLENPHQLLRRERLREQVVG